MFSWISKKYNNVKNYSYKLLNVEDINDNISDIKGLSSVLLSPKKNISNSHKESFEDAMARLGVNEFDLLSNYKNFCYITYISFSFSILLLFLFLYNLIFFNSLLILAPIFSIFLLLLSNAINYSFRAYQIKKKTLVPFSEWLANSSYWFPSFKDFK